MRPNILILGGTGMLGSMVYDYLSKNNNLSVSFTTRSNMQIASYNSHAKKFFFDADSIHLNDAFKSLVLQSYSYIINCIGIIKPYCMDNDLEGIHKAIKLNALFPHLLYNFVEKYSIKTKIIQIATDCVYSGEKGNYNEYDIHDPQDVYGKTKSLGEVSGKNFLNIRCSIIGPEIHNKLSLLEWFLSQKDNSTIYGYDHHKWNGITTLQFAELCEKIITDNEFEKCQSYKSVFHYVVNESVTKYELLNIFKDVFSKNIEILKVNNIGKPIDRTLSSLLNNHEKKPMIDAIIELRSYMNDSKLYEK